MAIIKDRPMAASQAERVNIINGARVIDGERLFGQMVRPIKIVSIIASRHRRADNK